MPNDDSFARDEVEGLPSWPARVLLLLISPGELFARLRETPAAWVALFLGAALIALANGLIPLEIWEEAMSIQMSEAGAEMPGDPELMARVGKVAGIVGSFIAWPLLGLVSAGILAVVFLFGMGYEGSYRQYLSITAHAFLVPAMAALLLVPLRIVARDPQFTLNLAPFFFFLEEGFLLRFLELQDLFNLWSFALLGLGVAAIDRSRSVGVSVGAALGISFLFTILLAAVTG